MNSPLWFSNLVFWSAQVALLVLVVGFLPAIFQIRQPRVLLAYWRALLMLSVALPFLQPWHRPQITGSILITPDIPTSIIPPPGPVVTHWQFSNFQIIAQIVGLVILAGIAVRFLLLALGLLKLRHLRQASSPFSASLESTSVLEEMRALVNARAEFRVSSQVDSPVTFGFAAPVILLPARFSSVDPRFQSAIACHELLHVRRHDWAHHLFEEILRAAFWFHPAIAGSSHASVWPGNRRRSRSSAAHASAQAVSRSAARVHDRPRPLCTIPAPPFLVERQLAERVALMLKEVRMSRTRLIASLTVIACCLALAAVSVVWAFPLKTSSRSPQTSCCKTASRVASLEA